MQQLLDQLGIDWHLLLSQAVNFFLLLVVLRLFVYKPLLKLLHDRRQKIESGITKAEEADRRLIESEAIKKQKIKEGEAEAVAILKRTETESRALEEKMLAEAKRKEAEELASAQAILASKEEESRRMIEKEAAQLVRMAIVKTVEMSPESIDDALIAKAVEEAKQNA